MDLYSSPEFSAARFANTAADTTTSITVKAATDLDMTAAVTADGVEDMYDDIAADTSAPLRRWVRGHSRQKYR